VGDVVAAHVGRSFIERSDGGDRVGLAQLAQRHCPVALRDELLTRTLQLVEALGAGESVVRPAGALGTELGELFARSTGVVSRSWSSVRPGARRGSCATTRSSPSRGILCAAARSRICARSGRSTPCPRRCSRAAWLQW
jgi:hypothetical protein